MRKLKQYINKIKLAGFKRHLLFTIVILPLIQANAQFMIQEEPASIMVTSNYQIKALLINIIDGEVNRYPNRLNVRGTVVLQLVSASFKVDLNLNLHFIFNKRFRGSLYVNPNYSLMDMLESAPSSRKIRMRCGIKVHF